MTGCDKRCVYPRAPFGCAGRGERGASACPPLCKPRTGGTTGSRSSRVTSVCSCFIAFTPGLVCARAAGLFRQLLHLFAQLAETVKDLSVILPPVRHHTV